MWSQENKCNHFIFIIRPKRIKHYIQNTLQNEGVGTHTFNNSTFNPVNVTEINTVLLQIHK